MTGPGRQLITITAQHDDDGTQTAWKVDTPVVEGDLLPTLQKVVDGFVEVVRGELGLDVWINEEGLYRSDFRYNPLGSRLAKTAVIGPVVITGGVSSNGDTLGISKAQFPKAMQIISDFINERTPT